MTGEIMLGRGEFDIAIATGRPPSRVALTTPASETRPALGEVSEMAGRVILDEPRILDDGFAFRARVAAAPCRIVYQYT